MEASEKCTPFADLMLEKCELSCHGVTQLIKTISSLRRPLKSLSVADNNLGRFVLSTHDTGLDAALLYFCFFFKIYWVHNHNYAVK